MGNYTLLFEGEDYLCKNSCYNSCLERENATLKKKVKRHENNFWFWVAYWTVMSSVATYIVVTGLLTKI